MPDRRRPAQARHVVHGFVTAVAHPDPHQQIGGISDRPVIMKVGCRPGFIRGRSVSFRVLLEPKPVERAGRTTQDVADQPGHARVKDLKRRICACV